MSFNVDVNMAGGAGTRGALQEELERLTGMSRVETALLLTAFQKDPQQLVEAELKRFAVALKLTYSDVVAEHFREKKAQEEREARAWEARRKQHEKMLVDLQADLQSERDVNVLAVKDQMRALAHRLRQGVDAGSIKNPVDAALLVQLQERFDIQLRKMWGWFTTRIVLVADDEDYIQLHRDIDQIPHGEIRTLLDQQPPLLSEAYRNKRTHLVELAERSPMLRGFQRTSGFTGSIDFGV